MKPLEIVTFIQNDLPCSSFAAFEEMRSRGTLCDVKISVQNHIFQAHRIILAAVIPYFQSLYVSTQVGISEEDISRGDLDPKALESLIKFAYTGKIDISFDNVYSLIRAAGFWRLKRVFDACVDFLLVRLNNDNAVVTHGLAHELAILNLIEKTKCYILHNFGSVSKGGDFLKLSYSCVREIISDDDLNVSTEETVFEAVVRWATASPVERRQVLPNLLSEVRMVYLHADYLINRVASEELIITSKSCMSLLEEVKNHRLLTNERRPFSKLNTRPRKFIYTNGGIYALFYCYSAGYSIYHCDLDNNRISKNLRPKERLHGTVHGVAAVNEMIYMFHERTIRTFHIKTLEWEILEDSRCCGMKGAAFVTHGNVIYCFGSCISENSNKVRGFDTNRNKWLTEGRMRYGRYNSSATSLGEHIYVTGGFWTYLLPPYMYTLLGYNGSTYVEKYDPTSRNCKRIAPMLTPRSNHTCCSIKGKIYVCGGGAPSDTSNTAEVYDPLTCQWSFVSSIPAARSSFFFVSHNNNIYAIEVDRGTVCFEVFSSERNMWSAGLPLCTEDFLQGRLVAAVGVPAYFS